MLVALRVDLDEMAELFFTTRQTWPYATRIAEENLCQGLFPIQGTGQNAPVSCARARVMERIFNR